MKTYTYVEYDEKDIELLRKEIPDNPCDTCSANHDGSCCGCPTGTNYYDAVKPYKNAGIYEIALKIKLLKRLKNQNLKVEEEIFKLEKEIPAEVLSVNNPFRNANYQKMIRTERTLTASEFSQVMSSGSDTYVLLRDIQEMISKGIIKIDYNKLEQSLIR